MLRIPVFMLWIVGCSILLAGCGGAQNLQEAGAEPPDSRSKPSADQELQKHLDALWSLNMRTFPQWATYEGIRDLDHMLADVSDEAQEQYLQEKEAIAQKVRAIDPSKLSPLNQDTRQMVLLSVQNDRAQQVCHGRWWGVSGLGGPQADYPMMAVFFVIRGEEDLQNLEARYRATADQIDQYVENLRKGVTEGYTPSRSNVERALKQLDEYLASSLDDDPMLQLRLGEGVESVDKSGLRDAVETVVRPALERYRAVLRQEVLPAARPEGGVASLPNGAECYAAQMAAHIGPGYTAEELHQAGLDELERIQAGMVEVGQELGYEDAESAQDVIARIKANPNHYAASEEQILERNRQVVARAEENMQRAFGRLPETAIEVLSIERHRAPDAPAAYYYSAPEDGSRSAIYYVNTLDPDTRPLFNLEALAFHEAIPGHHTQIALAKELPEVHVWRRNAGQTAYTEGWALYAELLADELQLYSGPLARFGMYNYQAWRAARLVVDTGLHHFGWSRQQAIDFMLENTALPANEVANEVDRYISWPGQALAYMVGRMEFEGLRAHARATLGDAFSLPRFHDAVLARGSVPVSILQENVEVWLAEEHDRTAALPDFRELWDYGNPAESEEKFRALMAVDEVSEYPAYRLQLLTQIGRTWSLRGHQAKADDPGRDAAFQQAHEILNQVEVELGAAPPVVQVRYLLERGRTFNSAGNKNKARPLFLEAWEVARRAEIHGLAVDAAHMLGIIQPPEDALRWNERAIRYAEHSDSPAAERWLGSLYNNTGWTHHDAGRYQQALNLFEKGLEWRQQRDNDEATRIAKWSVGRALRSLERFEEAVALQLDLEKEWRDAGSEDGFVYEELGELYLQQGDNEKAAEYFSKAYPLLKDFGWLEAERLERIRRLGQ